MTNWIYAALATALGVVVGGAVTDTLPRWQSWGEWRAPQLEGAQPGGFNENKAAVQPAYGEGQVPKLEILHSDNNYLIVNKPYDVRMDGDHDVTVLSLIHKHFGSDPLPPIHFAHRLDYATSGVLCCALNKKAIRTACGLFEKREVRKQYLAVCFGHIEQDFCEIEVPIADFVPAAEADRRVPTGGQNSGKDFRMTVGVEGVIGRHAHTNVTVLERGLYDGKPASKVLLSPLTGRRHQLRVHLLHIGHPIVGDYTYAKDETSPRMMLHAWRLSLPLPPALGGHLDIETPDPFVDVLEDLR